MSLRELPPGQETTSRKTIWFRFRYVPLIVLLAAAIVLGAGGVFVRRHLATLPPPAPSLSDAAPVIGPTDLNSFPSECQAPVAAPSSQPWLGGDAAKSEAVWQSHAADLTKAYVVGTDGYVDWGDDIDLNLSQAIGRRILSQTEARAWADYISSVQSKLAAMNIPFYVLVGPQKWQVYPEKLPAWAQPLRGSVSLDQLIAGYPSLPIIDVRQDLRAASVEHPVYSRVNSHWTDYGAQVAWNAVMRCVNKTSPQLGPLTDPALSSVTIGPDLSEFAPYGVKNPVPDWTIPVYKRPPLPVALTKSDGLTKVVDGKTRAGLLDLPLSTATAGAQSPKSLMLVRDSMGDSLSIPVQQSFAQTWQIPHYLNVPAKTTNIIAEASQLHPSVVILEFAERYLNLPAPPPE